MKNKFYKKSNWDNHEFQRLKKDVFDALVNHNNCRVFALEGDFGGCAKVNNYILSDEGTAKEAVTEIGFAIYRTFIPIPSHNDT